MVISSQNRLLKNLRYEARNAANTVVRMLECQVDDNPEDSEAFEEAMALLNDHDELTQIAYDIASRELSESVACIFNFGRKLYEQCDIAVWKLGY